MPFRVHVCGSVAIDSTHTTTMLAYLLASAIVLFTATPSVGMVTQHGDVIKPVTQTDLKPVYHLTRASGEMNDPNGLMALPRLPDPNAGGQPAWTYHMYFQSNDHGQSPGSIWGHATSTDLVHWTRQNRTGVKGSSGGGVSLPADLPTHAANITTSSWNAAVFASVPMYVGLSVGVTHTNTNAHKHSHTLW